MGQAWAEKEYAITDAAYQEAVERKLRGGHVSRQGILDRCKRDLPDRAPASIGPHLGNLSYAWKELGLPVLDEVSPFAHRPEKLIKFLKLKYLLR